MVSAGSRRQKSSRAYIMSVPCTLYQVSDTTVFKSPWLDFTSKDSMEGIGF